jgi:hypothetical protein
MRGLVFSVIVGVALAGQAAAAPAGLTELAGKWREASGTCEAAYLTAIERTTGPKGEAALVAVINKDGKTVKGVLPVEGSRKGTLLWDATGKAALRLIPLRDNKTKVSVSNGDTGLTTTTIEPCAGSRPDYDAADKMQAGLAGAWYEVALNGREMYGVRGVEGCKDGGDLFFAEGGGLKVSMADKKGVHGPLAPAPMAADPFIGGTWLKTAIGGETRYLSIKADERTGKPRVILADPATQKFRYFDGCPA